MASVPSQAARVSLYRDLLKTASRFTSYNYREYAIAHIKEDWRANKGTRVVVTRGRGLLSVVILWSCEDLRQSKGKEGFNVCDGPAP